MKEFENQEMSYKELCEVFGEPIAKSGRQHKQQLSRFQSQAIITLVPNKRGKYILERFLTNEEKDYIAATENYTKYVQTLILQMIANSTQDTFTYRQIREYLHMVNSKYFPIKYHRQTIHTPLPSNYSLLDFNKDKEDWIDIADAMDEQAIRYGLEKLEKRGVIQVTKTYVLYKFGGNDFTQPHILEESELKEMMQIPIDFLQDMAEGKIDPNHNAELVGKDLKENALFYLSPKAKEEYYNRMNAYVHSKGYTRFGRAFKIIAPNELERVLDFVSPKFNQMQVQRYLESRRFKTVPPFIHEFLTNEMIKE